MRFPIESGKLRNRFCVSCKTKWKEEGEDEDEALAKRFQYRDYPIARAGSQLLDLGRRWRHRRLN